jgi:KUP system potassium uptake protein
MANWLMMIGTVIVTAVYNNTTSLGHAYGVCVILVTFITTNLVTLVAIIVWKVHPALVFLVWLPFATFDGLYLTSALTKVPDGAWFTLLLGVILASFLTLWRYGKEKQWTCEAATKHEISDIISKDGNGSGPQVFSALYGGGEIQEIDGMGIFFDKAGDYVPTVYEQWLRKFRAQMDVVVLMHMRALSRPHVAEDEKFQVTRTSAKNVYRLIIRHGYNEHVITPDLSRLVYEEVRKAISRGAVKPSPAEIRAGVDSNERQAEALIAARLRHLDEAYAAQSLYLVGKQQMRINPKYNFVKKMFLELFLWVRENTRGRIERLNVPVDKLVEVGFVGQI